jgi:hypothetical protein
MVGSGFPLPSRMGSSPQRMLVENESKRWGKWADLILKFLVLDPVAIWANGQGVVKKGTCIHTPKRTYSHGNFVLLEVVDELDDARQRFDGPEEGIEFLVHGRQQFVDRHRNAGRLDQARGRIVRRSAHELRFELGKGKWGQVAADDPETLRRTSHVSSLPYGASSSFDATVYNRSLSMSKPSCCTCLRT